MSGKLTLNFENCEGSPIKYEMLFLTVYQTSSSTIGSSINDYENFCLIPAGVWLKALKSSWFMLFDSFDRLLSFSSTKDLNLVAYWEIHSRSFSNFSNDELKMDVSWSFFEIRVLNCPFSFWISSKLDFS